MKLGDISVNILQCLYQATEEQGANSRQLFQQFALADLNLSHPQRRISIPRYMRLGEQAIRLTGRQDIGLLMAENIRSDHFGLMGLAAQQAPDIGSALATLIGFERLYSSNSRGHSFIRRENNGTAFCFYSIAPYNRFNCFVVDAVLLGWLQLVRQWSGLSLQELKRQGARLEIEFTRPAYAARYQGWHLPVQFAGAGNMLWLPDNITTRSNPQHNPITFRQLQQLCQQQLQQIIQGRSLKEQVQEVIAMQLNGRCPTLADVAAALNKEPWTLNRQLAKETTGFKALLDKTRCDLATLYVRDTRLSLGEISYLLGFSSTPAFQRAFKRWHQCPAGYFRKHFSGNSDQDSRD